MKFVIMIIFAAFLLSACSDRQAEPTPSETAEETFSPSSSPITTAEPTSEATAEPTAEVTPVPTQTPAARTRVSRAVTTLLDKSENRLKNIRLAAESINAYILEPGEVFSFNKVVGERSAARGYLPAAAIIDGEKKEDYGGGVCQLASTVYQAAEGAGLEIIERHNHQKDVGYTAAGTDAAVNYGTLDMKFRNSSDSSVMVAVLIGQNSVIAEIFRMNH